jgi:hypothetical protein
VDGNHNKLLPGPNIYLLLWTELSYITTDGQSASLSWYQAPIWGLWPDFCYCQTIEGFLIWGALSHERTSLSFTMCNVQYTIHFTVSDLRLPQPWGPDPCIYIHQEQGGPVIPPGTGFSTRTHSLLSLLWLANSSLFINATLSEYESPCRTINCTLSLLLCCC